MNFKLTRATLSTNKTGVTFADCEKLEQTFTYFLALHKHSPLIEMIWRSNAVVDHHFNIHINCGLWCKWSLENDGCIPIQTEDTKKKCRCVIRHTTICKVLKDNFAPFFTSSKLLQCRHCYYTQKNESIYFSFSTVSLKTRTIHIICSW